MVAFLVSSLLGACFANGWRNVEGASSWARCNFVCSVSAAGATISPDLVLDSLCHHFFGRSFSDNFGFSVVAFTIGRLMFSAVAQQP